MAERRVSRRWLIAAAVLIVLAYVGYRLRGTPFQGHLFLATFRSVDWRWLPVPVLLMPFTYFGRALRWQVMLRPLGGKASLPRLTSDTAVGFTAVILLGRMGEVVRPYLISLSAGVSFSSQLAAWLLERLLDLLAVLLLFGFALIRVPASGSRAGPQLQWVLGAGGYIVSVIGALCLLFLIVFRSYSEPVRRRILSALTFLPEPYQLRADRYLGSFLQGVESTRQPRSLTLLILYTVVQWALIIAGYYTLFRAFPSTVNLTWTDAMVLLGFMAFGGIVQIPGIGGGVQVVSILVLTQIYGLTLEAATGITVVIWFITYLFVVPFGIACAFYQGWNWSKLKQLSLGKMAEAERS